MAAVISGVAHYFPGTARPDNRRPLVLFLHGLGASGQIAFDALRLQEFGQRYQSFVLAPDGTVDGRGRRFWNAHPACCNFDAREVDHVGQLDQLISPIIRDLSVLPTRVFVVGFSNGGFMAHRLACEWGDRLAGIVSVAGAGPEPNVACVSTKHLRVLEIHGDADETVRFEGGTLFNRPNANYSSARGTLENWAKRLHCPPARVRGTPIDLISQLAGAETEDLSYPNCAGGSVSLWTIQGGSHLTGVRAGVLDHAWRWLISESQ